MIRTNSVQGKREHGYQGSAYTTGWIIVLFVAIRTKIGPRYGTSGGEALPLTCGVCFCFMCFMSLFLRASICHPQNLAICYSLKPTTTTITTND